MTLAVGYESYVSWIMQDSWNDASVNVPTVTVAHLRKGPVFRPRAFQNPRQTVTKVMPSAAQMWQSMPLVDFSMGFEYVANDTAFLPLFTAAFGKRVKVGGVAPYVHTYTLNNPPVDPSTPDAGGTFYNRSLVLHHTMTGVATYQIVDAVISTMVLTMEANNVLMVEFTGVGQTLASASPVTYSDVTGQLVNWAHAISGANSGLYAGAANPPTTAFLARRVTLTLDNNLRFEPFLGAATGKALKKPSRAGFPSVKIEVDMDFDDDSATDAVSMMTDYLAQTNHNFRAEYYVDANNSLEVLASAATKPAIIRDPLPSPNNEGVVGFTVGYDIFPDAASTDFKLVQSTGV